VKKKVLESLKLVETFLMSYITDDTVLDQKAKSQCHESSLLMMSRFMTFVNVLSGVDTCKLQAALDLIVHWAEMWQLQLSVAKCNSND